MLHHDALKAHTEAFQVLPVRAIIAASHADGPVCSNTKSEAVATPTDKRGFITLKFWGPVRRSLMVSGGMGLPARMAARLRTCYYHPAHPLPVVRQTVVSVTPEGAKTMTATTLASRRAAPTPAQGNTPTQIPADQLHAVLGAFNATNLASSYIERGNFKAARRKLVQALASVNELTLEG